MTTLTLKIESDLKAKAQAMAKELGLSLSALIKTLLKNTVRNGELAIQTKPRYHHESEEGDLVFKNPKEAVAYFKKLANENGKMA